MRNYFIDVVRIIKNSLRAPEKFSAWFSAENLSYARFNHGLIRQAGVVDQYYLDINLISNNKQASGIISLVKNLEHDKIIIINIINNLREKLIHSADDPYLTLNDSNNSSEYLGTHELEDKNYYIKNLLEKAKNLDLVGSYIGGPVYRGFANSFGQHNWFEKSSFVLDTSIYYAPVGDKAVKQSFGGERFDDKVVEQKIQEARLGLELYNKKSIAIPAQPYRVYFAPAAVNEILGMLNWDGFSRKALEVKSSPLLLLFSGQRRLSPNFNLSENIAGGVGPHFQDQGFLKPLMTPIIRQGKLENTLISPKTAKEYNLSHNGADDSESMCALDLAGGTLEDSNILSELYDGLYINNLWYLNFSDRQNGCLTGMTRFFCFVVKNGKPLAPFSVMRFDDSIYRIFNENIVLTKNREMMIDNSTYDERSTSCAILPGIIAENVRFTL
jgi:predicted Zn-dependent protease